jgi:DNA repair protein RadC
VATNPYFNSDCECLVVLVLDTRKCVKGHQLVTIGTMDTLLVHPREVFRGAIVASACAIILMHNHPSGNPTPSDNDIKYTRDLIRAGQLLRIDVLDHVIMGRATSDWPKDYVSLRELGYFDDDYPSKLWVKSRKPKLTKRVLAQADRRAPQTTC